MTASHPPITPATMMRELPLPHGSPAWHEIRRGLPTASAISRIVTASRGDYAAGADDYAAELIAAALGWSPAFSAAPDLSRNRALLPEALCWLRLRHGLDVREAGFCLSACGRCGASPDGLTAAGEPVEIKTPDLHTLLKWRLRGGSLPEQHRVQCHAHLWITGADRCWFVAYTPQAAVESLVIPVVRDAFTEKLGACLERFCTRLEELQQQLLGAEYFNRIATPAARLARWQKVEIAEPMERSVASA